ncbi:hypothetical protein RAMLITH_23885 [Ramlibacter sp. RBP-2]|uniref:Uncharacterized protein n=1 Tax=Ramlibacter lithotrophicus TaxID=2606681 RepID=A0A7X6DKI4_9BURK|nr:hypothetical protein [Ramlibacter lithotrophicus]NKE68866.1 hypothetical protein [Ramlibacter lithotrophicus]
MALLRSCLKVQRMSNGAEAEVVDFPPAGEVIEMFAASMCTPSQDSPVLADDLSLAINAASDGRRQLS